MQKLGGFPVNSKLTVSTINVFFAGLPRWIPLRLAFLLVFGTSLEYTCGTRGGRGFDSSSDCLFLPFFCFFVFFCYFFSNIYIYKYIKKKNGKLQ